MCKKKCNSAVLKVNKIFPSEKYDYRKHEKYLNSKITSKVVLRAEIDSYEHLQFLRNPQIFKGCYITKKEYRARDVRC